MSVLAVVGPTPGVLHSRAAVLLQSGLCSMRCWISWESASASLSR